MQFTCLSAPVMPPSRRRWLHIANATAHTCRLMLLCVHTCSHNFYELFNYDVCFYIFNCCILSNVLVRNDIIKMFNQSKDSCDRPSWPAHRAGLLSSIFFGQPGSVSKFPPFLWVKLWVGWVGRGYTEISRYFPASWINWVTLVTKIKLLYSLRF